MRTAKEVAVPGKDSSNVVDKRNGWRVMHPTFLSFPAICLILLFGGVGLAVVGVGVYEAVIEGSIATLAITACVPLLGFWVAYQIMFSMFVAYDEVRFASGTSRRKPRKVVDRADIRHLTWGYTHSRRRGSVLGEDGRVLALIPSSFSRRQVADLARELGVPFRG
jgi:hypothetical protein